MSSRESRKYSFRYISYSASAMNTDHRIFFIMKLFRLLLSNVEEFENNAFMGVLHSKSRDFLHSDLLMRHEKTVVLQIFYMTRMFGNLCMYHDIKPCVAEQISDMYCIGHCSKKIRVLQTLLKHTCFCKGVVGIIMTYQFL